MIHQTFDHSLNAEKGREERRKSAARRWKTLRPSSRLSGSGTLLTCLPARSSSCICHFRAARCGGCEVFLCGGAELLEWSQRERTAAEIIVLLVIRLLCCAVIRRSSFKIHHQDWTSPEDSIHSQVTSYFLTGTRLSAGG